MSDTKTSSGFLSRLSQQYGGRHAGRWVDSVPQTWVPYIQLARLSPPIGVCLFLIPHIFGFLHGILIDRSLSLTNPVSTYPPLPDLSRLTRSAGLLLLGCFFFSNAAHGWNDLVDAPYDALVTRTKQRPIVRGALSKTEALIFTISQAIACSILLILILPDLEQAIYVTWPSVLMNFYYPYSKRHTYFAQYVLGFCISWGVVVGTVTALEAKHKGNGIRIWEGTALVSTTCLTAAVGLWTVIYDTIYAFQDRNDDIRIGLKSTAVLFGQWTKVFLSLNLALLLGLLASVGHTNGWDGLYYCFAVGGCMLNLGSMIIKVDLADASSCWWWFGNGFWFAGGSITVGLLSQYLF